MMDASARHNAAQKGKQPKAPLRIGLLSDRREGFENWQLALIDRILADDRLCLAGLILCPQTSTKSSAFLRLASAVERAILGRQPAYPLQPAALRDLEITTLGDLTTNLPAMQLDMVLAIAPLELAPNAFSGLRYGSWHLSFLDTADGVADWFGYREVISGQSVTDLTITVRRSLDGREETLARAQFNTKFSAVRNGDFIKERAVTLVMRELRRLAETRSIRTATQSTMRLPSPPPTVRQLLPYSTSVARTLLARGRKAIAARLKVEAPAWALFVGTGDATNFDPRKAILMKPDDGEFRADPFLFEESGQIFVFYEAYTARDTKAHIAVARLVGDRLEPIGVALEAAHHLSYPFVFRDGDQIFMIPETNQARRLEVWRAVDFPLRWELHATALEGQSPADSALVRHAGKWWLFTNLSDFHAYEDHCSELYLFEVDGPDLKTLTPHRNNPVVIGSIEARNAGRPFVRDGRLCRPSQRNEHGIYGYGLNIMEIVDLDIETYREDCIRRVDPTFAAGIVACHHLDAVQGRYVIDAMFKDQSSLLQ